MSTSAKRIIVLLLSTCALMPILGVAAIATANPAAASSYRYWTYWWGRPDRAAFQYAALGPASDMPSDGWVLGWRFQVTSPTGGGAQAPRTSNNYADLCSDPVPAAGQIRVAVVVDYGDASSAPAGEQVPAGPRTTCVIVPEHSRGSDVMRAASVSLRVENGFVCGINGYPMLGCATPVADTPTPTPTPTPKPKPTHSASAPPTPHPSPTTLTPSQTSGAGKPSSTPTPTPSPTHSSAIPSPTSPSAVIPSTGGTSSPSAAAVTATSASGSPSVTPVGTVIATQPTKVTESRNAFGVIAGIAGVALLAGSAWFTSRRRGGSR